MLNMLNRSVVQECSFESCIFRDDVLTEMFLCSLGISNVTAAEAQAPDEEPTLMSEFTDSGRTSAQQAARQEILERTLAGMTHTHTAGLTT
jgi:hypothetical protein